MVSAFIVWFGHWPVVIVDFLFIVSAVACVVSCFFHFHGYFGFCGLLILSALVKVAFYHCYVDVVVEFWMLVRGSCGCSSC